MTLFLSTWYTRSFKKTPTPESLLQLNGFLAKATRLLLQCSNLSKSTAAHRSGKNQDSEVSPHRCQSAHFSLLTGRSQASLCSSKLMVILSSAFCTYTSYGACNKPSSHFLPCVCIYSFSCLTSFPAFTTSTLPFPIDACSSSFLCEASLGSLTLDSVPHASQSENTYLVICSFASPSRLP